MKNLNMDVYGVEAMSKQEMQNENGGWILGLVIAAATSLAYDIISNGPDSVSSFKKGMDNAMSRWE